MTTKIENIIGKEEARNLRQEFQEMLSHNFSYDDVEDLLASYGLEPDYIEQLIGF